MSRQLPHPIDEAVLQQPARAGRSPQSEPISIPSSPPSTVEAGRAAFSEREYYTRSATSLRRGELRTSPLNDARPLRRGGVHSSRPIDGQPRRRPRAVACADAVERLPLSVELHYLHAVLLGSLGRDHEAVRAVRRVLYLDRSLAVGHFTLGSLLARSGDLIGARCAIPAMRMTYVCARPADEETPLSDGEPAGRLAEAAAAQRAVLDAAVERIS